MRTLELVEFELEKASASLDKGQPMILVWLDDIYQKLALKLEKSKNFWDTAEKALIGSVLTLVRQEGVDE